MSIVPPRITTDKLNTSVYTPLGQIDTNIIGNFSPWKLPVKTAAIENITLEGLQTINGIELQNYDRILLTNQDNQTTNGIYYVRSDFWLRTEDLPTNTNAAGSIIYSIGTPDETSFYTYFLCTSGITDVSNVLFVILKDYYDSASPPLNSIQYTDNASNILGSSNFTYVQDYFSSFKLTMGSYTTYNNYIMTQLGYETGQSPNMLIRTQSYNNTQEVIPSNPNEYFYGGNISFITGKYTSGDGIVKGQGYAGNIDIVTGSVVAGNANSTPITISPNTGINQRGGNIEIKTCDTLDKYGGKITIQNGIAATKGEIILKSGQCLTDSSSSGEIIFTVNNQNPIKFTQGGIKFTKNRITFSSLTPAIEFNYPQGFLTITDFNISFGNSKQITVLNDKVYSDSIVLLAVEKYDGNAVPLVYNNTTNGSIIFTVANISTSVNLLGTIILGFIVL